MRILVTGATGLLGRTLVDSCGGQEVWRLTRRPVGGRDVGWDPASGRLDPTRLEGFDHIVHLAGESIGDGRWTRAKKARIYDSRVRGTELLAAAISGLEAPPRSLVAASAVGYYGSQGDTPLTEAAPAGDDFLARLCQAWEAAARPAAAGGVRVVHLRLGVVLARQGGALAKMLRPFRMGLGGRMGDGRQFMAWIGLEDAARIIHYAMDTDALSGPVNAVAPEAVTNLVFTRELAKALGRPAVLPLPAALARLALGEMADHLLLSSTRACPERLLEGGFRFEHPTLKSWLAAAFGAGLGPQGDSAP